MKRLKYQIGKTALSFAVFGGHSEVVRELKEWAVVVDTPDDVGTNVSVSLENIICYKYLYIYIYIYI